MLSFSECDFWYDEVKIDVLILIVFILAFLTVATILPNQPISLILPFIGCLFIIIQFKLKTPHLVLNEEAREYENVMGLTFGQI